MKTRAILIERHGPPEVLRERDRRLRDPGPGEVHLRVAAVGVNFADLLMRMGLYGTVPPRPYSPGFEIAGRIARIGPRVTGCREGERRLALMRYGGYARDVVVPATSLLPWPGDLEPAAAAALPVVFLTAWVCLFRAGAARAGERVLILGAAGGVGTAAVQLAVRAQLEVLATAGSAEKRAFVEALGARSSFDSRGAWAREIPAGSLDLILDPVGGSATRAGRRLLGPLGRLVFFGLSEAAPGLKRNWLRAAWAWLRTPRIHPADLIQPNLGIHGVHLLHLGERETILHAAYAEMLPDFASGALRPILDCSFPLTADGAADAHRYLHARKNIGKVVLVAKDWPDGS